MISIVGFSQCVPHSQAIGQWKNPEDHFSEGYRQIESWTHVAKTLEKGFTADWLGGLRRRPGRIIEGGRR